MSSPVNIPFSSFIKIDRRKEDPVYLQIVYQFINAVKSNLLEDGDRLPGSRKIAQELQIHRKTVVAALDELQEQGWIRIVPNIGTFICNREPGSSIEANHVVYRQPMATAAFDFRKELILEIPKIEKAKKYFFTDGTSDHRIIKTAELARFYSWELKRSARSRTSMHSINNDTFFIEQLSYYLNTTRGLHLSRNFILPVFRREQVFSILSKLLIKSGDNVLVETLSYFLPNMIFNQAGARIQTVPVDENGMQTEFIKKHFKPGEIRFIYLSPRSQYPTTVKLSQKRRQQLLNLAQEYNFIVIEDDVDFESSSANNKETSLFKMDGGRHVIYIGGFATFLIPSFQMHFLVGPKDFLDEGKKYLNILGMPDKMMENALGQMIHQGDIHRYRRKSQKVLSERKDIFAGLLSEYFGNSISFAIPTAGFAFWVKFKDHFSLTKLQEKAGNSGVAIPAICLYQNRENTALRLSYAHLNKVEMEASIKLLYEVFCELKSSKKKNDN